MTEKRFVEIDDGLDFSIKHIESGEKFYDCESVVEILNELAEENQSSKEFIEQLQEELILFKKAGADMGNDLNAQISNLTHENQKQKREYRKLYDEMQDVYKSYRKELRKNTQLTGTIHRICAEHHINSKCYLEEEE